jgi:DNA-binding LytR/AlgR family response regulator
MKMLRILIVEGEPLIALELEMTVSDCVSAAILVEVSVAASKEVLRQDDLDFAFLGVDVTNGKTFELAQILGRKHVCSAAYKESKIRLSPS